MTDVLPIMIVQEIRNVHPLILQRQMQSYVLLLFLLVI